MADDLKYGYKGAEPTQSFGNNTGVFDPNDINNLIADNKWTSFGQLELIETQTYLGAVSYVDFTSISESSYNVHFMTFSKLTTGASSHQHRIQFYESGVLETANVYDYAFQYGSVTGSFGDANRGTNTQLAIENTGSEGISQNGYLYFYNLGDSSKYSFLTHHNFSDRTGADIFTFGSGVMKQSSTVDGIRLLTTSGNFTDFDISLYGIAES